MYLSLIGDLVPREAFARLDPGSRAPLAVAVSGGADSLCALIATSEWARRHGRGVLALSVDHRLQPQSGRWTAQAGEAARRLGCEFQALSWDGAKPSAGLPAAARAARHRLLAEAARAAGAGVLVTGHTLDDARENALMGLGALAQWSPSPAWPEGRELFLLRPLLDVRRADLRKALADAGWTWVDDPANDNPAHPRTEARRQVAAGAEPCVTAAPDASALALAARLDASAIFIPREAVRSAGFAAARRVVGAAALSAGGGQTPPRGEVVDRITSRLRGAEGFIATIAGARVTADARTVVVCREAREGARGGLAPLLLAPRRTVVWDGRFEVMSGSEKLEIRALGGLIRALPPAERRALAAVPAAARAGLPAVLGPAGEVSCPILAEKPTAAVRNLVGGRFLGACGVFSDEEAACDAVRVAKRDGRAYLEAIGERGDIYEPA